MNTNDLQLLGLGLQLFQQGYGLVTTVQQAAATGGVTDAQVAQALADAQAAGDALQAAINAATAAQAAPKA